MYKIPIVGLKVGTYEYDYKLDNLFFDEFVELEGTVGEINAHIVIIKSESLLSFKISLKGEIECVCDRCLDTFNMPFEAKTDYFIKFGGEKDELAENLIVVPDNEDFVDLKDLFYELYFLNIPLQTVHPEKDGESTCNMNMLEKLDDYSVDPVTEIDPRWEELKKLINNK
jgi:uncharacterized metal-binding protein YceD (DUF177 family)